jgi:hypothetical protein
MPAAITVMSDHEERKDTSERTLSANTPHD